MLRRARIVGRIVGMAAPAAFAASAWAQDYASSNGVSLVQARPGGATLLNINSATSNNWTNVQLPFSFPYYGKTCSSAIVYAHGCIVPGASVNFASASSTTAVHGQNATSGGFPYSSPATNSADGVLAPCWASYGFVNDGSPNVGGCWTWTIGTAPTRKFVVSWENVAVGNATNPRVTIQAILHEGSGVIHLAHSSHATSSYTGASFVWGIDSPIDARFTAFSPGVNTSSAPSTDLVLTPVAVTYAGQLQYDRIVSDATGIGNSVQGNVPIPGCRVELQRTSDGFVFVSGKTGSDGSFALTDAGLPGGAAGRIVCYADNGACTVGAGTPSSWTAASLTLPAGPNVGTLTLGLSGDPSGDVRGAFHVARTILAAYDWAKPKTSDVVPNLAVALDVTSSGPTVYSPAVGATPASLRIASRIAANPDQWDDAVITKAYGRHVAVSIAPAQTTLVDQRFDFVGDPQNAFAEGFGWYLWAAVSGSSVGVDGTSASTATVYDVEHPAIAVAKGPNVAGCVAGGLFDLLDAANESIDPIDGSTSQDRVFRLFDAFVDYPKADAFMKAWIDAGYDGPGVTRVFVANSLLADDASEPNDAAAEASPLGTVGVVKRGLVLNQLNEDWHAVTLPSDVAALQADVKYDQFSTAATIVLEVRDATGATTLATGALRPLTGAIHAVTGPLAAGTYLVRVAHATGGTIPTYVVQACVPLAMSASPIRDWTVGRPYDFPLGASDGIAPFTLTTPSGSLPPGLVFDAATLRAHGAPTMPGAYPVTVRITDGGDPANLINSTQVVTIHDELQIAVAPFVGFPAGKAIDASLPTTGGTPPFTLSMSSGALPGGLAFAPSSLHVTGTASVGPSVAFELDGVDVAGSADHVATRGVVCVQIVGKKTPADLGAGTDACGWWFDAVQGSTATFSVATGKGKPKRLLAGALLAPSRALVTTGKIVGKAAAIAGSKLVCPQSGRYCFIASSTDSNAATQLLGTLTVRLPTSGKNSFKTFAPSQTTTFEFGAVPGSTAVVKFAGDKRATLAAKVVSVVGPDGVPVNFPPLVKPSATGGTLTLPTPKGGTWTIVLGATSTNGTSGRLSWSLAIKQAKGAVYSAD